MAIVAFIGGEYVAHILAGGSDAIVAVNAGLGYLVVVEYRITPGKGTMAVIAVFTALDVIRCLAGGNHAVMAVLATSVNGEMVDTAHLFPVAGLVAELTIIGCADMHRRRCTGSNPTTALVTFMALGRGAQENALDMTAIATDTAVNDIEGESAAVMIETVVLRKDG